MKLVSNWTWEAFQDLLVGKAHASVGQNAASFAYPFPASRPLRSILKPRGRSVEGNAESMTSAGSVEAVDESARRTPGSGPKLVNERVDVRVAGSRPGY